MSCYKCSEIESELRRNAAEIHAASAELRKAAATATADAGNLRELEGHLEKKCKPLLSEQRSLKIKLTRHRKDKGCLLP